MPDSDVSRLLANTIFELIPTKTVLDRASALPTGASVSVTVSPDKGMGATVELALQLAAADFHVIPHLSARATTSWSELEEVVRNLERAGISHIFVVGGDTAEPGEFFDAIELLTALAEIGHEFKRIGVTGYPEGHPTISDGMLMKALHDKLPYASYIATQMCFDAGAIRAWIGEVRESGIDLPIWLGVPGAVDAAKLISIGARIGVGQSLRFLRKQRKAIAGILRGGAAACDDLITDLAPDAAALGIEGLHVFTFNAVSPTAEWWTSAGGIDADGPDDPHSIK